MLLLRGVHRLKNTLPWKLPTDCSRYRKARMQIGKEPAGVGLNLGHPEAGSSIRAIHNQTGGEGT